MSEPVSRQTAAKIELPILLLLNPGVLSMQLTDLVQVLRQNLHGVEILLQLSDDKLWGVLSLNGREYSISVVNGPAPVDIFEAALSSSKDKPRAASIVRAQQSHILVTPVSPAADLTQAFCSAGDMMVIGFYIGLLSETTGYIWVKSQAMLQADDFKRAYSGVLTATSDKVDEQSLPLMFWLNFSIFTSSDKRKYAAQTIGLKCFLGVELQIDYLEGTASNAVTVLYDVLSYIFTTGTVLRDGEDVHFDGMTFRVKKMLGESDLVEYLRLVLQRMNSGEIVN